MSYTFADLSALRIDVDALPAMTSGRAMHGRTDAKRGAAAKRETLARRQMRMLKVA